ncbi:MAG: glycine cleavage T C-terminal barrel domain-containing protein [Lentilitoribacter sp.]
MESGLDRFIKMDKDFIGKQGLEKNIQNGPRRTFVSLTIDDYQAPAQPGDSIVCNDKVVGTITSAAWGYRTGENIALGFIDPEHSKPDAELMDQHIDKLSPAKISDMCRYDPQNEKVRS